MEPHHGWDRLSRSPVLHASEETSSSGEKVLLGLGIGFIIAGIILWKFGRDQSVPSSQVNSTGSIGTNSGIFAPGATGPIFQYNNPPPSVAAPIVAPEPKQEEVAPTAITKAPKTTKNDKSRTSPSTGPTVLPAAVTPTLPSLVRIGPNAVSRELSITNSTACGADLLNDDGNIDTVKVDRDQASCAPQLNLVVPSDNSQSVAIKPSAQGSVTFDHIVATNRPFFDFPPADGRYSSLSNAQLHAEAEHFALQLRELEQESDTASDRIFSSQVRGQDISPELEDLNNSMRARFAVLRPACLSLYGEIGSRIQPIARGFGVPGELGVGADAIVFQPTGARPYSSAATFLEFIAAKLPSDVAQQTH